MESFDTTNKCVGLIRQYKLCDVESDFPSAMCTGVDCHAVDVDM
jgi:hypothetical protein